MMDNGCSAGRPCLAVVDDEERFATLLAEFLAREGWDSVAYHEVEAAVRGITESRPDAVILDLAIPYGEEGFLVLQRIRERHADLPVIMLTGKARVERAVKALKLGATDFLEKPLDADRARVSIRNAIEQSRLRRSNAALRAQGEERYRMVGSRSPAMAKLRRTIAQVAPADTPVLITGETGTGKELVARAIHLQSGRWAGPYERVNCAAIPANLIESELFGREKGAFTGAVASPGKLAPCDKGTVLLDEIGDMEPALQAKVLRFLQEGELERVGGTKTLKVDVRVLAATNKNLPDMIRDGRFREDLYYRINAVTIRVPPLRERREDIPELVEFFREGACADQNRSRVFSPGCLPLLSGCDWPGNVRQLEGVVKAAVALTEAPTIEPEDIRSHLAAPSEPETDSSLKAALDRAERESVLKALRETGGNVTEAAALLKVDRTSLHRIIKRHAIDTAQ
jgi:DNA-binding NtrC family response regulator